MNARTKQKINRRGAILIDLMVTLGITFVAMNIGAQLLMRVMRSQTTILKVERELSAADRAVHLMRLDVERSATLRVNSQSLQLDGVRWDTAEAGLTRIAGDHSDRFEINGTPTMSAVPGGVKLRIGQADWYLSLPGSGSAK